MMFPISFPVLCLSQRHVHSGVKDQMHCMSRNIIFFFSFQRKKSGFKATEPLVYVDGLEAGLKPGGQQASAKEYIFKTCTLQGFGNLSFFV